eukprot:190732-Chlamydomonas_euryale.AAC.19
MHGPHTKRHRLTHPSSSTRARAPARQARKPPAFSIFASRAGITEATSHLVLHLGRDVQGHTGGGAARTPGDVAEDWRMRHHALLALKQVLNALRFDVYRKITHRASRGLRFGVHIWQRRRGRHASLMMNQPPQPDVGVRSDALPQPPGASPNRTSSVRGGKNSNEKKGFPSATRALILSATFIALAAGNLLDGGQHSPTGKRGLCGRPFSATLKQAALTSLRASFCQRPIIAVPDRIGTCG